MRRTLRLIAGCTLLPLVALGLSGAATSGAGADAPEGGTDPDLTWHTIDGGGGASAGAGDLLVTGTIGQHDAGPPSTGGDWSVAGGFWAGGSAPPPPACPADLDGSNAVDFNDLVTLLAAWGLCDGCPQDLDGSGTVDFNDLVSILAAWGPCPG